jgi:hypothetical protein
MTAILLLLCLLFLVGCQSQAGQNVNGQNSAVRSGEQVPGNAGAVNAAETPANKADSNVSQANVNQPNTVRDFFNLLPQKYFLLEGCEPAKDKNCERARAEYVKNFLEVEDAANGYWKSGCDGAQSCLTMAIFKRPDGGYIVQVLTEFEMGEDSYFLEYKNGKWTDIGASVVPEFSAKNTYVPPRKGTTVEVFKKNFPEPTYSERGAKIYDLEWKDGRFSIKR